MRERVEAAFSSVLSHPAEDRTAFLADICGNDEGMIAEVRALLAAHESSGEFMSDLSPEASEQLARPKPEQAGDLIGNYKLLQEIGDGGFGTVWMAEQQRPVRRRVALKILKMGMDTDEVMARFEQERQALAMMDHSNIAKVFDAGATKWGRPFFAMELVEGVPITQFCDEGALSTEQRLKLFSDVCSAINHAHQKGVIHRDIKPSNVMVTLHGEKPVVKVIDFGIAKATQGRLTDQTLFTRLEQFVGTPVYMSPEQAALSGVDIDTRSDIYSLGILLYELLTGKPPFDAATLGSAGYDEMRRIIREVEPLKPSARLKTTIGPERTLIARTRHTEPWKIGRLVEPDLDWIVMKAIEKDRSRRYETASGLAADIQHFLAHEPIVARPPSLAYKLQKGWQRNKLVCSAAAAVGIALITGTAVALWQASEARREKAVAETQSASAKQAEARARMETVRAVKAEAVALGETARAKQTAEFLDRLLYHAAREIKQGRNPEALKLALGQSSARLAKLQDDPDLQGDLMERMANFYRTIGEWKKSLELSEAHLELIARVHGRNSLVAQRYELEYLVFVDNHGDRASVPPALQALRRRVEKHQGRGSKLWFDVQCELIRCWIKLRLPQSAVAASEECIAEAQKQNLVRDAWMNVQLFHEQALESAERFEEAETILGECRQRIEQTENPAKWRKQINDRALYLLERKRDFAGGAEVLRAELKRLEGQPGDHRRQQAEVLRGLAQFESRAGQHQPAVVHGKAAVALARELGANPDSDGDTFRQLISAGLRQLAECEIAAGQPEDAIGHAKEAGAVAQEQGDLEEISKALVITAQAQVAAGLLDDAYQTYEARIDLRKDSSINYRNSVDIHYEMSEIRMKQGRPADAFAIAADMWKRSKAQPAASADPGNLEFVAKQCLKTWAALQAAQPETNPPSELEEWRAAAKRDSKK
jgi:serine/threonine protein kinase